MVNLVHFLKIFHFSTWCPICGRSRLHSTGGLHMPGNYPTAMSRTSFCIVFLKSILGLFIWLYSAPLWLCAITFHWASLPSTLQVHIKSYADKLSFLLPRQQQVWLEGNLIYLEYSRIGRKLLHSNICKCIHHRHPAIAKLADDGFVISMWSVLNCFLMVHIKPLLFMPLHCV